MKQVLVLYYSRSGATAEMARLVARGAEGVAGVESILRTVPEVSETCEATTEKVPDNGAPYVSLTHPVPGVTRAYLLGRR